MKKLIYLILLLAAVSCNDDDDYQMYSYNKDTIYSDGNTTQFTEVIGFVSPYIVDNGTKMYVVTDNLKNITLSINQHSWTARKSYSIDTERIKNKIKIGDYWTTAEKIIYPIVVNVRIQPEVFTTAGDYANLLNNYFTLSPGLYVCQVQSFDISSASGTITNIYMPSTSLPLEVKENQVSANVGYIEVEI